MLLCFDNINLKKMTVLSVIFFAAVGCDSSKNTYTDKYNDLAFYNNAIDNLPYDYMPDNTAFTINKAVELKFSPKYLSQSSSNGNMQHYEVPSNKGEFYNIVKIPETKPDFMAIGISILALLSSVIVPIYLKNAQRREDIHDGFWLREVIFPKINDLMFSICADLKNSFEMNNTDFSIFYKDVISIKIDELHEIFSILNSFPNMQDSITKLEAICDDLDNNIDNNQLLPTPTRIADVTMFNTSLIKELVQIHKKI